MKVKINDVWHDSLDTDICVLLTDKDRENIANMSPDATQYASFHDNTPRKSNEEKLEWMDKGQQP